MKTHRPCTLDKCSSLHILGVYFFSIFTSLLHKAMKISFGTHGVTTPACFPVTKLENFSERASMHSFMDLIHSPMNSSTMTSIASASLDLESTQGKDSFLVFVVPPSVSLPPRPLSVCDRLWMQSFLLMITKTQETMSAIPVLSKSGWAVYMCVLGIPSTHQQVQLCSPSLLIFPPFIHNSMGIQGPQVATRRPLTGAL